MALKIKSEADLRKRWAGVAGNAETIHAENREVLRLPSRCIALNYILGGGIPYGRVIEGYGYESSGKSLMAIDFAYAAQSLGGIVLWGDIEQAFDPRWMKKNGLDLKKLEVYDRNDIEGFSDWAQDMIIYYRSILQRNEPILLVCDSIAALECFDAIGAEQSDQKAKYGKRAGRLGEFYTQRLSLFKKMGVCVFMINQVRVKIGATMFESAEKTPGGDATKFYSSIRVSMATGKQVKGRVTSKGWKDDISPKGKKVGHNLYLTTIKNKTAPPGRKTKVEVYFTPDKFGYIGLNKYMGLPEVLEDLGVLKKKGSYYYLDGKSICQGEDALVKLLHEEEDTRSELIRLSKINTIGKTRRQLEKIEKNLFPVKVKAEKESVEE